jgi:hypothetical protein
MGGTGSRQAIGSLLLVLAGAAGAQTAPAPAAGETVWHCWYNAPEHVTCLTPQLRHRFMHIPLLTQPSDMAGVRRLAQAVMCRSRAACRVDLTDAPSAAELEAAMDPLLAVAD